MAFSFQPLAFGSGLSLAFSLQPLAFAHPGAALHNPNSIRELREFSLINDSGLCVKAPVPRA
jgi:hypothetical protein